MKPKLKISRNGQDTLFSLRDACMTVTSVSDDGRMKAKKVRPGPDFLDELGAVLGNAGFKVDRGNNVRPGRAKPKDSH